MSKRGNPFIEDFVQQSKIHVGVKQFNNTEDRLKAVYGAKKVPTEAFNHDTIPQTTRVKKQNLKQLCLAPNGSLRHDEVAESKQVSESVCSCNSRSDAQCGYCETPLCAACQHPCQQCDKLYCRRCSISGSEGTELCVSCYG